MYIPVVLPMAGNTYVSGQPGRLVSETYHLLICLQRSQAWSQRNTVNYQGGFNSEGELSHQAACTPQLKV